VRQVAALLAVLMSGLARAEPTPDADAIVRRSTVANRADWTAAPSYAYTEQVRDDDGARTYNVAMLLGTPYKQLVAIDGRPLSPDRRREEARKLADEQEKRRNESPGKRAGRIGDYHEDRERAHRIIEEMPRAFRYTLRGARRSDGRTVYVLAAAPRDGYEAPTTETRVLTAMRGEFWIDATSFHLVRATAWTVRGVSIAGVLARVEAGTEFSLEQIPVGNDVWLPRHYQIRSHSRILGLFSHHIREDHTYSDYRRTDPCAASESAK
jgi:hypothetical protein